MGKMTMGTTAVGANAQVNISNEASGAAGTAPAAGGEGT